MASLAYRFAMVSDKVLTEVYDVNEFEDVASRYNVSGVPKTVINETVEVVGAIPEKQLLDLVLRAAGG